MNREILFRGKQLDSEENDWVYGYYYVLKGALPNSSDRHVIVTEGNGKGQATIHIPVDSKTVGQFTGLTDKNGEKIFYGDVVIWDEEEWGVEYNETVRWDYELLHYRMHDWGEHCVVVGNIHDNEVTK